MKSKKDQATPEKVETPAIGRRFRIEKLEERVAPKKGGKGTHNCPTNACTGTCFTAGCGGY